MLFVGVAAHRWIVHYLALPPRPRLLPLAAAAAALASAAATAAMAARVSSSSFCLALSSDNRLQV